MRKLKISIGEHYHIYNRGVMKREIFRDQRDIVRFLFALLHFSSSLTFDNIAYDLRNFANQFHLLTTKGHRVSGIYTQKLAKIVATRGCSLLAFNLRPNHFHLIIRERKPGGISRHMQRSLDSYTKYFNTKYKTSGHLFQGPFQAVHIENNDQLLYTSAYIHRHDQKVGSLWSSYQDYWRANRWGTLLDTALIIGQFKNGREYREWVETCGAKEAKDTIWLPDEN